MTKKAGGSRRRTGSGPSSTGRGAERRRNVGLREVLDELIEHVRQLAGTVSTLPPSELEYAQQRLEWLADEVWRLVMEGKEESGGRER